MTCTTMLSITTFQHTKALLIFTWNGKRLSSALDSTWNCTSLIYSSVYLEWRIWGWLEPGMWITWLVHCTHRASFAGYLQSNKCYYCALPSLPTVVLFRAVQSSVNHANGQSRQRRDPIRIYWLWSTPWGLVYNTGLHSRPLIHCP